MDLPIFHNPHLFEQAMTHSTYLKDHPELSQDNERLEFLGDALLNFLVGELLYQQYPALDEGELTRQRAALVQKKQLAQFGQQLGLAEYLRLGKNLERDGGRLLASLLSNTFEALIASYYLDSGLEAVREFVETLFLPVARCNTQQLSNLDPKSQFQQWVQAKLNSQPPTYRVIETQGPAHAKQFTVEVLVGEEVYGVGTEASKQAAGRQAAQAALKKVGLL